MKVLRNATWNLILASEPEFDADARIGTLERAVKRERNARQQAESLLETKSRELYLANKDLSEQHEQLKQRNTEIELARESLLDVNTTLQESYATTVEVFARLIQSRAGLGARTSVATDAMEIGRRMNLTETRCDSLYKAALLCDVGKLSLPDESVHTPYTRLDANAQREYHRHPVIAEATLLSIQPLAEAASIIRNHCERVDGTGFPDKTMGDDIPTAALIHAVTKAYSDLMDGRLLDEALTSAEAREFIVSQKGKRYDESTVDLFVAWLDDRKRAQDETRERKLTLGSLRPGSTITRDLCDANGVLILAKGQIVSESMIDRLVRLQRALGESLVVYTK